MRAHIVVGDDFATFGPRHDNRIVSDIVGDEVARGGDLLLAAGDLPNLRPQVPLLPLGIRARRVAGRIEGHQWQGAAGCPGANLIRIRQRADFHALSSRARVRRLS